MMNRVEMLMQDETFVNRMQEVTTIEEMRALLAEEGVVVTDEELAQGIEEARCIMENQGMVNEDGELSDEVLDAVSGGKSWGMILAGVGIGVAGAFLGAPEVVLIGGLMVVIGWCS